MSEAGRLFSALIASVFGLAILSVIVSRRANTGGVISAASTGLAGILTAATSPITGTGGVQLTGLPGAASAAGGNPLGISLGSNLGAAIGSGLVAGLSGLSGYGSAYNPGAGSYANAGGSYSGAATYG